MFYRVALSFLKQFNMYMMYERHRYFTPIDLRLVPLEIIAKVLVISKTTALPYRKPA